MVFKKAVLLFWVVIPAVMAISTWTDGPTFDISYDTDSGGVVFQTENLGSGDNLFLFFGADKIGTDVIKFQGSDGTVVDMFSTDESTLDTDLQSHLTPVDRLGTTEAPWNLKTTRQLDTSASDTDSQDIVFLCDGTTVISGFWEGTNDANTEFTATSTFSLVFAVDTCEVTLTDTTVVEEQAEWLTYTISNNE